MRSNSDIPNDPNTYETAASTTITLDENNHQFHSQETLQHYHFHSSKELNGVYLGNIYSMNKETTFRKVHLRQINQVHQMIRHFCSMQ